MQIGVQMQIETPVQIGGKMQDRGAAGWRCPGRFASRLTGALGSAGVGGFVDVTEFGGADVGVDLSGLKRFVAQ